MIFTKNEIMVKTVIIYYMKYKNRSYKTRLERSFQGVYACLEQEKVKETTFFVVVGISSIQNSHLLAKAKNAKSREERLGERKEMLPLWLC
jgi:hypothetical protein